MTTLKLSQSNIVILASAFNPSIATKDWLNANAIHQEPDNFINTPLVSVYELPNIQMLIDQSRLQITCREPENEALQQCTDIVRQYVEKLPHTPYTAIGFNYIWEVSADINVNKSNIAYDGNTLQIPAIAGDFDLYAVGAVVLARKDNYQIRAVVEPSLDTNKPIITTVNYHYELSNAQMIADTTSQFIEHVADSERLVHKIFEESPK